MKGGWISGFRIRVWGEERKRRGGEKERKEGGRGEEEERKRRGRGDDRMRRGKIFVLGFRV